MKKVPLQSSTIGSTVKAVLIGSATALPLMAAAFPALAQSNDQQIEQMQQQINDLQGKVANLQAAKQAQSEKAPKGAENLGFKVGNTTLKFGGYVKLDAIYNVNEDLGTSAFPSAISTKSRADITQGHFLMHAHQTRLTFESSTPTEAGAVKSYIGMDFFGSGGNEVDSNSYSPRLRQAYLTWNHWLFGQAWSTFSDFHYGTTLDFNGPIGEIFMRQAQIRYTFDMAPGNTLDLAVENPQEGIRNQAGDIVGPPVTFYQVSNEAHDTAPDVVARYQYNQGPASFELAALGRRFKLNGVSGNNSAYGWGADIGGSYELPTGTTLMATFTGGDGVGRYLYEPFVGDAYVDNNGDVKALSKWGGTATISQKLSSKWTANLVYGFAKVQSMRGVNSVAGNLGSIANKFEDVHANLLYRPVAPLMFGIEYIYTYASYQDGSQGDANTIQFSSEYDF